MIEMYAARISELSAAFSEVSQAHPSGEWLSYGVAGLAGLLLITIGKVIKVHIQVNIKKEL